MDEPTEAMMQAARDAWNVPGTGLKDAVRAALRHPDAQAPAVSVRVQGYLLEEALASIVRLQEIINHLLQAEKL